jgi:hypothetical protein
LLDYEQWLKEGPLKIADNEYNAIYIGALEVETLLPETKNQI